MRSKKLGSATVAAALAAGVLSAPSASAASEMWAQIKGIQGESAKCPGCVDVLAWSWGMSAPPDGCAHVTDVSMTKWLDSASPGLMMAVILKQNLGLIEFRVQREILYSGAFVPYVDIALTDPMVSSVSTGGSGGEDRQTENVTFSFSSALVTLYPLDGGAPVQATVTQGACF